MTNEWTAAPSTSDWYGFVVVERADGEKDYFDGYSNADEPDVTTLAPPMSKVLETKVQATPQGRFHGTADVVGPDGNAPDVYDDDGYDASGVHADDEPCEDCDGDEEVECEHCNGVGTIEQDCDNCTDGFVESHDPGQECADPVDHSDCYESCDECDGSGNIAPDCDDCSGTGKVDCSACC